MKKNTRKDLEHELRVLKACGISRICDAYRTLENCGIDKYLGSAVTITIKNINREKEIIIEEVAITDGLSAESIDALKNDLKRSYDLIMSYPHNKI